MTKCSMHAHDDLALHRQLTFMRMQQMPPLPVDVNSVLCKTADEAAAAAAAAREEEEGGGRWSRGGVWELGRGVL